MCDVPVLKVTIVNKSRNVSVDIPLTVSFARAPSSGPKSWQDHGLRPTRDNYTPGVVGICGGGVPAKKGRFNW